MPAPHVTTVPPEVWAEASRLREDLQVSSALARLGRELISLLETPEILTRLAQLTRELLRAEVSGTVVWMPTEEDYALVTGPPGVGGA